MALPITVNTFIEYCKISSFLSATDFARQNLLKGGAFPTGLPMKLSIAADLLEWNNDRDSDDETLVDTANYGYQLCGRYIPKAKLLIANNMQGIIINPANGAQSTLQPIYLQFRVGVTASPVSVNGENVTLPTDGQNSFVMPLTYILNSLEGTLDGVQVPMSDPLQTSMVINYTNNNATITLQNGATFHNNDLWIFDGYQYVAI